MFRMRCTERCKARAAREAVSLSEYLRTELHRVADCPTPDELLERFRSRKRARTSETGASAFGPSATSRLDRRRRLLGPRCVARRRCAQRHRSMPFRLRRTPRPTAVALGTAPYPRGHHPHDRIRVLVRTARTSAKATRRSRSPAIPDERYATTRRSSVTGNGGESIGEALRRPRRLLVRRLSYRPCVRAYRTRLRRSQRSRARNGRKTSPHP
jgi:hypothetical protein